MKKFSVLFLSIFLSFLLVFSVAAECIGTGRHHAAAEPYMHSENLALHQKKNAMTDGRDKTVLRLSENGGEAVVDLGAPTAFNHIILKEKGLNVRAFTLSASTDGEHFTEFYKGDKIEFHRLCTFQPVTARYVKLTVEQGDMTAKIREMEIYMETPQVRDDFRVAAYSTIGSALYDIIDDAKIAEADKDAEIQKQLQKPYFQTVTDYIIIGNVSYDENGVVATKGWSDTVRDEQTYFARMMQNLHKVLDGTNTNIVLTVLNPIGEGGNAKVMQAITANRDTLIDNIISFANRYKIDGIDLDWEFPLSKDEFDAYNAFLQALKAKMRTDMWNREQSTLSIAVATWALKYTPETIDCLDYVNVMGYDILDQDGYHSSFFSSCVQAAEYIESQGFSKAQINIGFPFYGTYIHKNMEQYGYNTIDRAKLDAFADLYVLPHSKTGEDRLVYFNSPAVIRDKTAYAVLKGYGGVMIFSLYCDIPYDDPLSLTFAIESYLKEARG